jgi:hypothetical protein
MMMPDVLLHIPFFLFSFSSIISGKRHKDDEKYEITTQYSYHFGEIMIKRMRIICRVESRAEATVKLNNVQ